MMGEIYFRGDTEKISLQIDPTKKTMIKRYRIAKNPEIEKIFTNEKKFLSQLDHPNIIRLVNPKEDTNDGTINLEYFSFITLAKVITDPRFSYNMKMIIVFGYQIFDALVYIHERHIVHRNLTSSNVLVALDGSLKIMDFSKALSNQEESFAPIIKRAYLPPEILRNRNKDFEKADTKDDVFSVGIILCELIMRRECFQSEDFPIGNQVNVPEVKSSNSDSLSLSRKLSATIKSCVTASREDRWTAEKAMKSFEELQKSFQKYCELLEFDESRETLEFPEDLAMSGSNDPEGSTDSEWKLEDKVLTDEDSPHPPHPARQFKTAMTLIRKNLKDGEESEVFEEIQIPVEYSPDTGDHLYRSMTLKEQGKDDPFHVIASGNFVDIISAKFRGSKSVAAKRYKIAALDRTIDGFTRLRREIQISRSNRHENVVRYYEAFVEVPQKPTHIWLVTERMDQTLEKYFEEMCQKDQTNEPVKRDLRNMGALLTQLLRALDYLHQKGIIHRDVTPGNIGINRKDLEIKLLNFGLARETNSALDYSTNVDIPPIYKSFESLMKTNYDKEVDIWAAALVAIEMLGMKLFMPTGNVEDIKTTIKKRGAENAVKDRIFAVLGVPEDQYKSIVDRKVAEKPQPGQFDDIWKKTLEPRLKQDFDPLERDDFVDLIKKMLNPDRRNRLGADECLHHRFLRIFNEEYDHRATIDDKGQPRNDQGMKMRNKEDRDVLVPKEKNDQPATSGGQVQPRDDSGMRMRNNADRDALLSELTDSRHQRIHFDDEMK